MKKTLVAAAAILVATTVAGSAADLAPRYTKAPVPVQVWSWTGFYLGAHVGAGWGTTESSLTSISSGGLVQPFGLPLAQNSRSGFLGGGQVGYNWQSGWAVFGIQGDIAGMDVKGSAPCLFVATCTGKSDWLATVSGRIGGVVADKTLVYAKGGAAWLHSEHSLNVPAAGGFPGGPGGFGGIGSISADSTTLGWLIGFGAEYAFSPNWTAFIEYDYMDFEKKNVGFNLGGGGLNGAAVIANTDIQNKLSIAKVGVNYKFGY